MKMLKKAYKTFLKNIKRVYGKETVTIFERLYKEHTDKSTCEVLDMAVDEMYKEQNTFNVSDCKNAPTNSRNSPRL